MKINHRSSSLLVACGVCALSALACSSGTSDTGSAREPVAANLQWTEVPFGSITGKFLQIEVLTDNDTDNDSFTGPSYQAERNSGDHGSPLLTAKCRSATVQQCQVVICGPTSSIPGWSAPPPAPAPGELEISGGNISPPINTSSTPAWDERAYQGWAWSGGEPIRFKESSGAAGSVPSFDRTLAAPSVVTLTEPELPYHVDNGNMVIDPLTIDRSKDLDVAWTYDAAASSNVTVSMGQMSTKGPVAEWKATCNYPVADKHGIVPAAVLSQLPDWGAGLSVWTIREDDFDLSDWHVELSLATPAQLPGRTGRASTSMQFK